MAAFLFAVFLLIATTLSRSAPTIETQLGKIVGTSLIDSNQFLGVPFATPPVGDLRFRPSTLMTQSWKSEYHATTWGPACMQTAPYNITYPSGMSEDCLYLNIWQPKDATPTNLKPTLVFIHGGFGTWGSPSELTIPDGISMYNGTVLAAFDIVVVTIQYRLNVFGAFTNAELFQETNSYGGMNAISDQITALKWVQSNIKQFGGNKDDVTVFGESFGANSVCSLIVTPFATGLFKNAFQESGGCNWPGAWGPVPLDLGLMVSNSLMTDTQTTTLAQVRALTALELEKASNAAGFSGAYLDDYVMPQPPYTYYQNNSYNVNPTGFIILGSDEMDGVTGPPFYTGAQPQSESQYKALLNEYLTTAQTNAVMQQYPYNDTIDPSWAWWQIGSDVCVRCPTLYTADNVQSKNSHNPSNPNVYVYQFDGPNRSSQPPSPHGGELCFLFNNVQTNGANNSCQSFFVVDYNETYAQWMQETMVSAIKNPNQPMLQPGNVEWGAYGKDNNYAVIWDDTPHVVKNQPDKHNCDFWLKSGISRGKLTEICWNGKTISNHK